MYKSTILLSILIITVVLYNVHDVSLYENFRSRGVVAQATRMQQYNMVNSSSTAGNSSGGGSGGGGGIGIGAIIGIVIGVIVGIPLLIVLTIILIRLVN